MARLAPLALLVLAACAHAAAPGAADAGPSPLTVLYTGDGRGAISPCG